MKKFIRFSLGVSIASFFIWLCLKNIDFNLLLTICSEANISLIACATVLFFVGYSCRIERWRLMLVRDNTNLKWSECILPFITSIATNNVVPFRAGDLLRAFGFNDKLGVSAATSITSLLVERLLDLLMVMMFLAIALASFDLESTSIVGVGRNFLVACVILILALLLFPNLIKPITFKINSILCRMLPRIGLLISKELSKIFLALEHTSNKNTMIKLIVWSFLSWLLEGLVFWFVAFSIPTISNDLGAWIALPLGTLATILPSTPGYVGTFDYFTAHAMTSVGNSLPSSTVYAFMVHTVLWLPPTIFGGLLYLCTKIFRVGSPSSTKLSS
jgi:uncharacterized protein (TIRG00374 family)